MDGWIDTKAISDIVQVKEDTVTKRIKRRHFTKTRQVKIAGKGARGGLVWQIHISDPAIPEEARQRWLLAHAAEAPAGEHLPAERQETHPAVAADRPLPTPCELKEWQRRCMDARLYFMRLIERAEASGIGVSRAIDTIFRQARHGELPPDAARLVPVANRRAGTGRALSRRSLFNWWSTWLRSGKNATSLAPSDASVDPVTGLSKLPPWGEAFLACYQRPQKPSIAAALESLTQMIPLDQVPSYAQARRFLRKVGAVERERGRRTGQELRSLRPYVIRDTTEMWPGEVYISDGLTFQAWGVAHPVHGRPISPEIVDVVDVATRKIVGWSVGVAESGQVMAAALRHAIETSGIPAGWYHDNGPGYENKLLTDETTGILSRCGITNLTSIPLQSQGRGIIEKLRRDLWHKAAKELPTYGGRDMDRLTGKKIYRAVKEDLRGKGSSDYLMPWSDFISWCAAVVAQHNDRPHRSLPKVRDPETGRMRHMTPNEAWGRAVEEGKRTGGWEPMMLDKHELDDLFLPEQLCTVHRGMVRLFGNTYFAPELEEHHGERVRVGYDIHHPEAVRVRLVDGRLICFARFEANRRRYFPVSVSQQMIEQRAEGRRKRLEAKLEAIELERRGLVVVEKTAPQVIELTPEEEAVHRELLAQARGESPKDNVPFLPENDFEAYLKLCEEEKAGLPLTEMERQWMADYKRSELAFKRVGLLKSGFDPFGERYRVWLERQKQAEAM